MCILFSHPNQDVLVPYILETWHISIRKDIEEIWPMIFPNRTVIHL